MSHLLLDTNAYVAFTLGDRRVLTAMAAADRTLLSFFAFAELQAGFYGGTRVERNRQVLHEFLNRPDVEVAQVTHDTAECYGRLWVDLKRQGTPIPINDVWIAAQCLQTASVLVTYDRHFLKVPGLRIWPELRDLK